MRNVLRHARLVLVGLILALPSYMRAEVSAEQGKQLFKANCARCHYVTDKRFVGPGLAGVQDRWSDEGNLLAWIRNSSDYLKTGDSYATKLFEEYNGSVMPAFQLSDDEIKSILAYIADPGEEAAPATASTDGAAAAEGDQTGGGDNTLMTYILIGVAVVLLILARSLNSVSKALENVRREKAGEEPIQEESINVVGKTVAWMAKNKRITAVIAIVLVGALSYKGFVALNTIGVYEGYQPKQPIAFSHKLHVGQNKIECQYCHSTVEKSRHANIPSANVCMNCHKAVQEGPQYGKNEITKIYAAVGWNPEKNEYFKDYAKMDKEELASFYGSYLGDEKAAAAVEPFIQSNIEWVQIHKLPDHAYFNHAQHVKVGKVECTTCHGEVGEMEEVYQHSPLTMGWCINCHRETEVQYATNGYYERLHQYYKEHKGEYEMREGQAFTVEKIGGLECSKCHY
jgi:mono/diheme cytochrome c family protein